MLLTGNIWWPNLLCRFYFSLGCYEVSPVCAGCGPASNPREEKTPKTARNTAPFLYLRWTANIPCACSSPLPPGVSISISPHLSVCINWPYDVNFVKLKYSFLLALYALYITYLYIFSWYSESVTTFVARACYKKKLEKLREKKKNGAEFHLQVLTFHGPVRVQSAHQK